MQVRFCRPNIRKIGTLDVYCWPQQPQRTLCTMAPSIHTLVSVREQTRFIRFKCEPNATTIKFCSFVHTYTTDSNDVAGKTKRMPNGKKRGKLTAKMSLQRRETKRESFIYARSRTAKENIPKMFDKKIFRNNIFLNLILNLQLNWLNIYL